MNQMRYSRKKGRGKAQYDRNRRKGNYNEKRKKRRKEQTESKYLMLKMGFLPSQDKSLQLSVTTCSTDGHIS